MFFPHKIVGTRLDFCLAKRQNKIRRNKLNEVI